MRLLYAGRTFAAPALDCTGVFGRDWSHAEVVQAFRPHNGVFRKIPGPEGSEFMRRRSPKSSINGKPFVLAGVDWDYGGTVYDWKNGALAACPPVAADPASMTAIAPFITHNCPALVTLRPPNARVDGAVSRGPRAKPLRNGPAQTVPRHRPPERITAIKQ